MPEIAKTYVGNAMVSAAADHVLTVADNIYDEGLGKYQNEMNNTSVYISGTTMATVVVPSNNPWPQQ